MKFRIVFFFAIAALLLTACSFSLAEDITPPPNYVSPTPAPTMGALFPNEAPSPANGAPIYTEKCAPCHGDTGLGNGPQSKVLNVPVPAIGLPEIAGQSSPADYYTTVTQGRIDKFMPPFSSLTDQERWDVVSYVYSLSGAEFVDEGKALYEVNCLNCHGPSGLQQPGANFTDQQFMANVSPNAIIRAAVNGVPGMPGNGNLSEEEQWSVASYVRTFSFDVAAAVPTAEPTFTPVPPTATPEATAEGTISPDATPDGTTTPAAAATAESTPDGTTTPVPTGEATADVTPTASVLTGTVTGSVIMGSGSAMPANLPVVLAVYKHDAAAGTAPELASDYSGTANTDGTYKFENVEIDPTYFYLVEVTIDEVPYQSEVAIAEAGQTSLEIAPLTVYESTTDYSTLVIDKVHTGFNFPDSQTIQVFDVYIFSNSSDKTIIVETDGESIPFILFPEGATSINIQDAQMGGTFVGTSTGFAIRPSDQPYGITSQYNMPYDGKVEIAQPFALPVTSVTVFAPQGLKVEAEDLKDEGLQEIQGFTYNIYSSPSFNAGDTFTFTISGKPESTETPITSTESNNSLLLIAAGLLGVVLIAAGGWLFWRDRRRADEDDEETDEEESAGEETAEELMDAINALDDQYKSGNISEDAYQQRRAELKNQLKNLL